MEFPCSFHAGFMLVTCWARHLHVEQKMQKENALSSQDGRGRGYQHRDLSVVR